MAGDEEEYDVEGSGHPNQPITWFHFNALRDHLRREFRTSLDPIEEKQDKLSQDLQQLMGNVMRTSLVLYHFLPLMMLLHKTNLMKSDLGQLQEHVQSYLNNR